jgi:hypothetical protein
LHDEEGAIARNEFVVLSVNFVEARGLAWCVIIITKEQVVSVDAIFLHPVYTAKKIPYVLVCTLAVLKVIHFMLCVW